MRVGDIQLAFPVLLLGVAMLSVLGASLGNLIAVLALSGWVTYARIVRGETLSLAEREFVAAARALGARDGHVIRRHILVNVWPPIIVVATFSVARVIIAEASLSFLGLGIPPPAPSWGAMRSSRKPRAWRRIPSGAISRSAKPSSIFGGLAAQARPRSSNK